ncbi:MAG: hypothetical protein ACE14O_02080 [Candidatus Cloacimonadaceae bacterium]
MYRFERLEFPKKYPIPNWIKLAVLIMILAGIGIHSCSQRKDAADIVISNVQITDYTRVSVEVDYTLQNKSKADRIVWLYLRVYGPEDEILGDALYSVSIKAGAKQDFAKIIDKLSRPLLIGEKPAKATLEIYKRKVLS